MSIINYDISIIIDSLEKYNYLTFPNNEIISSIYNQKINKIFLDNMKIIEKYQ